MRKVRSFLRAPSPRRSAQPILPRGLRCCQPGRPLDDLAPNPGPWDRASIPWAPAWGKGAIVPGSQRRRRPGVVTPRSWQTQVLGGARGVGEPGELGRTRPLSTLALREALGSGPGPAFSRFGQRHCSPSLSVLVCKLGVGMASTSSPRGNSPALACRAAAVSTITVVTASSCHESCRWDCGPARPPPLALSPL